LKKKNLVILCSDQYRADFIGAYGHKTIGTQHLDKLADEGVRFDKAYCAAPLCGPSRVSFTTSMRMSEHGRRNYWSCIDYHVPNVVNTLKKNGYKTSMYGKNHLFLYDQLGEAWDELHEICLGNYDEHEKFTRSFSAFQLEDDHRYNVTEILADEAVDFIERQGDDEPFLCWVNWQDPHPAFTCPEPYYSMFDPKDVELPKNFSAEEIKDKPRKLENWRINSRAKECGEDEMRQAIATYMGQCRYIDDNVGKIMKCLEDTGKLDDTIVIFFGDHGELLGDFGVYHKIPVFYECLARIPVIIRYPKGMVKPFVFDGLIEEVDLVPTLFGAMGIEMPQTMVGRNFHEEIAKSDGSGRETALVEAGLQEPTPDGPMPDANHRAPRWPNSFGPGAMLTDGRYKLSMYFDDKDELYDLETDPDEQTNIYGKPEVKEVQDKLTSTLVRRLLSVGVRPAGDWKEDWIDVRSEPVEGRERYWEAPEMFIKPTIITQKEE
jgi:arylsulfatase A-like enzyme